MRRKRRQNAPQRTDEAKPTLDLNNLPLPAQDRDALKSLAELEDEVRAPVITPSEERYPPTRPRSPQPDVEQVPPTPKNAPRRWLNRLTLISWLGSIGLVVWFAVIWLDPNGPANPLPPPTPFLQVTATPLGFAVEDSLPTPNAAGQIIIVATETPPATLGDDVPDEAPITYPFALLDVAYIANGNGLGCDWSSIAGTVTDIAGNGLSGYRVQISGSGLNEVVFSNTALTFGPGGFELPLTETPAEAEYRIQLADAQGNLVSDSFAFTTQTACDSNVVVANFVQN